jgi:hypothetical protein
MLKIMEKSEGPREKRIKKILQMYYSRPEVQKAIFDFSANREITPSFMMENFGKRPDSFQYVGDIFELVKKGATSFHCSEEIWENPLEISTGMSRKELDKLRTGWDLLLDIDSKYLDYSKIMVLEIMSLLKFHKIRNVGIKFSGSKGFHMIIPWKAFPKNVNGVKTKDMFPEWPRIIVQYIMDKIENKLIDKITELSKPNKYVRDFEAPKEVIPDLQLVSSRHLFRMPYSLHEKTSLASYVLDEKDIENFDPNSANPMEVEVRNFTPNVKENEAKELLMQALDWYKEKEKIEDIPQYFEGPKNFEEVKISDLKEAEKNFPPTIKKILEGIEDGRKRALFILLNFFRSLGIEKKEIETRIYLWNEKNAQPLKKGYIKAQLDWSFRNKIVLPPNFDKIYYRGIGIIPNEEELRYKNPISYTIKKIKQSENKNKNNSDKNKKFKK